MARDDVSTVALGALLALALTPVFWPTGALAKNDKIDQRDEICAAYKGTSLFGQCTRAVTHDCQDSALAAPQCERWAQAWRDQTGDTEPPWLLECGGGSSRCVFVTSSVHNGDLGGLAGADAICQGLADLSGSLAAHGTYKAWLSASGTGNSAAERLAHATVPYKLVDGSTVADDWADLTDGSLDYPINITEGGSPEGESEVWTATDAAGNGNFGIFTDCKAWTETILGNAGVGLDTAVDGRWSVNDAGPCQDGVFPLYCFQQP